MFKWLAENGELTGGRKIAKFLFYAFVEILLVLIGILLAVQIDAGITKRKNNKTRCAYLDELLVVMQEDISDVEGNIQAFKKWNPKILEVAKAMLNKELPSLDSLHHKLGTVGNYISFGQGSVSKIEELNYAQINLIENRELKNKILKYQNVDVAFLRDREKRYDRVSEDLRVYYTKNFFGFNYQDAFPNDLDALSKDREYLSLVKQRYEWNGWFSDYYESIISIQKEIEKMIIMELEHSCGG